MTMWENSSFSGENPFGSFTAFSQFSTLHWMSFVTTFLSQSSTHLIISYPLHMVQRMRGWEMVQSQAPFHLTIPTSLHLPEDVLLALWFSLTQW